MMIVVRMRNWRLYGFLEKPGVLQLLCDPLNVTICKNDVVSVQYELAITSKGPDPEIVATVLFEEVAVRLKHFNKFIKVDFARRLIPTKRIPPARNA